MGSKARDTADLSNGIDVDSSGNVGIGTSSPTAALDVRRVDVDGAIAEFHQSTGYGFTLSSSQSVASIESGYFQDFVFKTGSTATERMRIDSSGNLLVGKTSLSSSTDGFQFSVGSNAWAAMSNSSASSADENLLLNRTGSDGEFIQFKRGVSTVGSIGTISGDLLVYSSASGHKGVRYANGYWGPTDNSGTLQDNAVDLGTGVYRFNEIYAGNAAINTSDRNEKQDIETLNAAETRVAVACKGLLRKFRWKDAVAEKGDDARIHFGIIAQDLRDAFIAEGLDAGRYAMFISNTWWETQTDVPAVQAVAEVLDDDGNVVTEAVEAKEAYTRTDTYETQAEAPAGATERTRLGVRYPELLAFIIGAM